MAYPQQEQRIRAIFDADDAAEITRRNAAKWLQDGFRPEVGIEVRSVPGRWMDQPGPDRMADGVSDWPYRLAACGNAVVPQIPELIGRAILSAIAAATGTAKTAKLAECEASQSGAEGNRPKAAA
jgi:hypothetical protein